MNKEIYGILLVNVQQTVIKDIQVLYFIVYICTMKH